MTTEETELYTLPRNKITYLITEYISSFDTIYNLYKLIYYLHFIHYLPHNGMYSSKKLNFFSDVLNQGIMKLNHVLYKTINYIFLFSSLLSIKFTLAPCRFLPPMQLLPPDYDFISIQGYSCLRFYPTIPCLISVKIRIFLLDYK